MNVPPQIREAFTSAIASTGNGKQEIQLLKLAPPRMRGVTQPPGGNDVLTTVVITVVSAKDICITVLFHMFSAFY